MAGKTFLRDIPDTLSSAESDKEHYPSNIFDNRGHQDSAAELCTDHRINCHFCPVDPSKHAPEKNTSGKIVNAFVWFGKHSLEIYLLHTLLLNIFKLAEKQELAYMPQFILVILNYMTTILLSIGIIKIIQCSNLCNRLLFQKSDHSDSK